MPYAPGVVDRSGEIRAQYMMQGRGALGEGIAGAISGFAKQKEETDALKSKIKGFETVIKNDPQSYGMTPEKVDEFLADRPNETIRQRAQRIQSTVEQLITSSSLKKAEAARQAAETENQMRVAQIEEFKRKAKQQELDEGWLRTASQAAMLPTPSAPGGGVPPSDTKTMPGVSVAPAAAFLGGVGGGSGGGNISIGAPAGLPPPSQGQPVGGPPQSLEETRRIAARGLASGVSMPVVEHYLKAFGPQEKQASRLPISQVNEMSKNTNVDWVPDPQDPSMAIVKNIAPFSPNRPTLTPAEAAQTESAVGMEKMALETVSNVYKAADRAEVNSAKIDTAIKLLKDPDVKTGVGQGFLLKAKQLGSTLGIDTAGVAKSEQLQTLLGEQMMGGILQLTKGAVSDREMGLFQDFSAGFGKTNEGNIRILELAKEVQKRAPKERAFVNKLRKEGKTATQIEMELNEWRDAHSVFTKDDVKKISPGGTSMSIEDILGKVGIGEK